MFNLSAALIVAAIILLIFVSGILVEYVVTWVEEEFGIPPTITLTLIAIFSGGLIAGFLL